MVGCFSRQDQIRPDDPEEDEDELDEFIDQLYSQLGITDVHPFIEETLKARLRCRVARLDADDQIRLLMHPRLTTICFKVKSKWLEGALSLQSRVA
jgi:hypothetical protein